MKNLIILLIFSLIAASCKKDTQNSNQLTGKWELESSLEGFSGRNIKYQIGQGNILEFSKNAYSETRDSKLLRQGRYTIIRKTSMITRQEEDFILFDGGDAQSFFSISNDKLSISQDAYDGGGMTYNRVN
ncbi:hypothetical protein DBR40_09325 [Pedobacter sp. KBW01]|uniref:hypothetical protein n=1 Tax=Pedobacter sp. KBW01 TaxID=2153364 RepID=UPI000F5ADCBC|nr:hypothetical protein [Pedobacter sp. KBW01]RQO78140.1 hypothetical protein DBR40_09325 [Pedobacter sp. KBW01]